MTYDRTFVFFDIPTLKNNQKFSYSIKQKNEKNTEKEFDTLKTFQFSTNLYIVPELNQPHLSSLLNGSDLKVLTFGDHDKTGEKVREKLLNESFDFMVLLGDYSYDIQDNYGLNGDEYFDWMEPIFTRAPIIVTPGNHENFENSEFFNNRFKMPGTVYPSENNLFIFQTHMTRMIGINLDYLMMNESFTDIYYNLINETFKDLSNFQNTDLKYSFFFTHRPFHCQNHSDECEALSKQFINIETLLNELNINVNLWGHVHHYERLDYIYDEKKVKENNRFSIISGSAGNKELEDETTQPTINQDFVKFVSNDKGYVILDINQAQLKSRFYSTNQEKVIDEHLIIANKPKKKLPTIVYFFLALIILIVIFVLGWLIYSRVHKQPIDSKSNDEYETVPAENA